jgi:hypothetical protein
MKRKIILLALFMSFFYLAKSQVVITQYYEGTSVNKWIELTNLGGTAVNTALPQLKIALYSISGSAGNMNTAGTPSQTVNLTVVIPAYGTVLIGNTGNGSTEIPYLTAASAAQTSNSVINFNGNDGVALLDANGNILDAFGDGINAMDKSYTRNTTVSAASPTFNLSQWTELSISTVQNSADLDDPNRLGVFSIASLPDCIAPVQAATNLQFGTTTAESINATFTAAAGTDGYFILASTSSSPSVAPSNGANYSPGSILGNSTVINTTSSNSFTATGLLPSTTYYFFVYSFNNTACNNGPTYYATAYLSNSTTTQALPVCAAPAVQATALNLTVYGSATIQGRFSTSIADQFLVVRSSSVLNVNPVDGINYTIGQTIGNGTVVQNGINNSFNANGLQSSTTYYFTIFALNNQCSGGPKYLTSNPLKASVTTTDGSVSVLNYYFGNLHAHSSYSDGNKDNTSKTPVDDYAFAKLSKNMDFLGISEHNHTGAGMNLANWQPGMSAAQNATTSNFVAMYGMEWGTISGGGHVIVYGVDSLINWEAGQYQIYVPKSTYTGNTGLFKRVTIHGGNAVAYLAHPNTSDYNNLAANLDQAADDAIVGSAVESGPAFSTSITYNDAPSLMSYLSYYQKLLARGYHVGPVIDHDNHNLTFGRTYTSRLVIMAPALTETNLLQSMKQMHFYASEDSTAQVTYTIGGKMMGSIFTAHNSPDFTVSMAATGSTVSSIKIMKGVPGSGTNATTLYTANTANFTYTDQTLADLNTAYYYLDILESDGNRVITSPIWYTRDDNAILPIDLTSFFAVNEDRRVLLKWTTASELNNQNFELQRYDAEQKEFITIGTLPGSGTSTTAQTYVWADMQPLTGNSYYRLKQVDFNGKSTFSQIRTINRVGLNTDNFLVYPNPIKESVHINFTAPQDAQGYIKLIDMAGKQVFINAVSWQKGEQQKSIALPNIKPGNYILVLNHGNQTYQTKVVKQ